MPLTGFSQIVPIELLPALLLFARLLGMCMTAPGWSTPGLSWSMRLVAVGWLVSATLPVVGPTMVLRPESQVGWMLIGELAAGATLGLTAGLIIAGARQAGEVVGLQTGLSAGAFFDPEYSEFPTPMGQLYHLIALAVFLSLDGPLSMVRGVIQSYIAWPVGALGGSDSVTEAFKRVGLALGVTVTAASPAALALTLAGVAIGLLGRAAPSVPLMALAMPIRFVLGMLIVIGSISTLVMTLSTAWTSVDLGFVHMNWRL